MNIYFGDSLTASTIAQVLPGRTAWPWWIHLLQREAFNVLAVGGQRSNQQTAAIYGHVPQPKERFFYLIGTNDRLNNGSDPAGVTLFGLTVAAQAYWLAGNKLTAQQPGDWTFTGAWADYDSHFMWKQVGRYTSASGAVVSAGFDGDELVFGYTMVDGIRGSVQVSVDGVDKGSFSISPPRQIGGVNPFAPGVIRITGNGAGHHTAAVTLNSGSLLLDWIGRGPNGQHLYLLTLPYTVNNDAANVNSYNNSIRSTVDQLAGSGYLVRLLDANAVVNINEMCADVSGYSFDGAQGRIGVPSGSYHPSNHADIRIAVEAMRLIELE